MDKIFRAVLILAIVVILPNAAAALVFEPIQKLSTAADPIYHNSVLPQIAVSGSNVYVVWLDTSPPDGYAVLFRRSTDGGATFSPVQMLSDRPYAPYTAWSPQIVVSGQNVYVVYYWSFIADTYVIFRRSTDGGATFEPAVYLEGTISAYRRLQIAVDGLNVYIVYTIWNGDTGTLVFRRSTDGGVSFEPRQNLSLAACCGGPKLAASAGRVYVVFREQSMNLLRRSLDSGVSFETAINVSDTPGQLVDYDPELEVMDGNIFVTWWENSDIFFRRSTDGGASFEPIVKLSDGAASHHTLDLAVSGSNVYVLWPQWVLSGRPGEPEPRPEIFFRRSADGGATFEAVQNLSGSAGAYSMYPRIAAEGSAVFVGWAEGTYVEETVDFLLRTSLDGGATFGPAEDVGSDISIYGAPEIAVQMPNIFVAWSNDKSSAHVFFRRGVVADAPPLLTLNPSSLDFGPVALGSPKDLDFTVQNTGGGILTGNAATSAPFSIVGDNSFSLGPNETKTITVRFSPTSAGIFNGNVNFTSNGGDASPPVTGTGTAQQFKLTINKSGTGTGTVTSRPSGINCGTDCEQSYTKDTVVKLTPTANSGSTFVNWSGACTGNGACAVTLSADKSVTAAFNLVTGPAPVISSLKPTSGTAGTIVSIRGKNFGFTQGTGFVGFGSVQATVNSWGATQIKVVVPAGPLGAVPVAVTTPGGTSNIDRMFTYVISAEPLIQTLTTLRDAVSSKIDIDLDYIVTSFGDAKDIQRALFWFDWANAFYLVLVDTVKAIFDTISLFGSDVVQFLQKLTQGIEEADTFVKTASWIHTIQGLWKAGENLQLSIDGPAYSSTVKKMVQQAEKTSCKLIGCLVFNKARYESTIKRRLQSRNASPLRIPHRSSDVRRTKFEVRSGVDDTKKAILRKIDTLIKLLSKRRVIASDFPMEDRISALQGITAKVTESRLRNVDVSYSALLADGENKIDHTQTVSLGKLAAWEETRRQALKLFDDNALIEQLITLNTLQDAVVKAVMIKMEITFKVLGESKAVVALHSLMTGGIDLALSSVRKEDHIRARDLINQIPQSMLFAFPEELSDLWMIIDDVTNTIMVGVNG